MHMAKAEVKQDRSKETGETGKRESLAHRSEVEVYIILYSFDKLSLCGS